MQTEPPAPAHHYAIVAGIDRYPALSDLRGACNDATAFHDWLVDSNGGRVPAANVRLHLGREASDARSARPKQWEIDADLDEIVDLARVDHSAGHPTRLYIYFAGHGIAAGTGTAAWLMADAKHNLFNNMAVEPYRAWLDRCRDFDEVVILSDCCRSIMVDVQEGRQPHTCDGPGPREQRLFLAHAADIGERAFETWVGDEEAARGHFTRALLEGLGGAATDADGDIRASRLAAHLRARVRELSSGAQRANVFVDDRMVVASNARLRREVQIELSGTERRSVQVLGASGIVATEVRGSGTWTLRLVDGDYTLVDTASDRVVRFTVAGIATRVVA